MKTSNHAKLHSSTDCKHFEYIFMSILNEYIQETIECGFTLKRLRDMIRIYS